MTWSTRWKASQVQTCRQRWRFIGQKTKRPVPLNDLILLAEWLWRRRVRVLKDDSCNTNVPSHEFFERNCKCFDWKDCEVHVQKSNPYQIIALPPTLLYVLTNRLSKIVILLFPCFRELEVKPNLRRYEPFSLTRSSVSGICGARARRHEES